MTDPILVIGATGMLGESVARRLVRDGQPVRVLARDPARALDKLGAGFEIVEGDVERPDTIRRALEGCRGVHVNLMGGPLPADFDRVEHLGTARVAQIAAKLGVERLTYLSGAPAVPENAHDPGTKAKIDAEAAIQASGVPFTIFRVSWFMESLSMFVRGGRGILIGNQAHPVRWVAAEDYAAMVSTAYSLPAAANRTFFVAGPEAISKAEALRRYCEVVLGGARMIKLPIGLMRVVATISFDRQLQTDVRRMAFYDTIGDDYGDLKEANELLGGANTTLDEWLKRECRKET